MTLESWHYQNECPTCGKNWGEHRGGYSASKCKMEVPVPPTELQEAIEEVKRENEDWGPWHLAVDNGHLCVAIATILNAVVKGELKHE